MRAIDRLKITTHEALYEYPEHLRPELEALPRAPGVYLFHDDAHAMPLYIGKSVDIRTRVLSHFRAANEARLLRQARRITHIRTAGDLGAQLLEARLIKMQQPLHNKKLRRRRRIVTIRFAAGKIELVQSHELDLATADDCHGLFASKTAAQGALRVIADEHRLCYGLLGVEMLRPGRPCFRTGLRRCAGACCGKEPRADHDERLRQALQRLQVAAWPFAGRIGLVERGPDMRQVHVLQNWHYLGSASTVRDAKRLRDLPEGFDRDGYRILVKPLLSGDHDIVEL